MNKYNKQLKMCELSIHKAKLILIDTDKCYDRKVGNMLKTADNKYISKKVIKNKKHKLYWRHLYSYLNEESIELINQMVYEYLMKNQVLKIERIYRFMDGWGWDHNNFRNIKDEDLWVNIDVEKRNIFDGANSFDRSCSFDDKYATFADKTMSYLNERIRDTNKKSKKIQKYFNQNTCNYFRMSNYCCGIMKNGDFCGCSANENYRIDRDYYHKFINRHCFIDDAQKNSPHWHSQWEITQRRKRYDTELKFCSRHFNQITNMEETAQDEYVDKIYRKFGYELKHGILCKVCK